MKYYLIIFAFILSQNVRPQKDTSYFTSNEIDTYIKNEMSNWDVPGLSICIIKNNEVLVKKSYGMISVADTIHVNNNTLFPIASLTKSITSTALLKLLNEKKIKLNKRLNIFLKDYSLSNKSKIKNITIKDLLSHRTGYKSHQGDFFIEDSDLTKQQIIEKVWSLNPYYTNNKSFGYHNVGYLFAGDMIEQLSGKKYFNYINKSILTPLGMNYTIESFNSFINNNNRALPHTIKNEELILMNEVNYEKLNSAGGLYSNINDLSKWLLFQINNGSYNDRSIICNKIIKQSHKPITKTSDNSWYGLGWYVEDVLNNTIINHSGSINGFTSKMAFSKKEKLGVVVLANTNNSPICEIISSDIIDKLLKIDPRGLSTYFKELFKEFEERKKNNFIKSQNSYIFESINGEYVNSVYGKIIFLKTKQGNFEVTFEHHPNFKSTFIGMKRNSLVFKNSDFEIYINHNQNYKKLQIKFSPFIDSSTYLFIKK